MIDRLHGYLVMTKPRAMLVVLVTAAAGYLVAAPGPVDWLLLTNLLIGAGLSGGGSIVLNQYLEREHDGKMRRTRARPLPSGLVSPREALVYGVLLSVVGTAWLALGVNALTSVLGGLCVLSYVLLYTPLKRVTTLNTAVGAVPGAIPPMMGWAAETGDLSGPAWILFAILFVWQFPHFLSIAWIHREDYSRAGYAMLSGRDPDGRMTSRQILLNAACLLAVSLAPVAADLAGGLYLWGALILGAGLLALCAAFAARRTTAAATILLRGTIVHISLLMILLVVDKS